MFTKTILSLVLLGATSFIQASPIADNLFNKRACTTSWPDTLIQLSQTEPDKVFPNTWQGDRSVSISQDVDANGNKISQLTQLISFPALPAGSYGCELHLTFPPNAPITVTGAAPTLNVYTVSTPLASGPTYNNVKLHDGVFGTVTVKSDQSLVINSEGCNGGSGQGLAFVFKYADWIGGQGTVRWTEYFNALNGEGATGVYLKYDC